MYVCALNSCVEALIPQGDCFWSKEVIRFRWGHKDEALIQ